MEIKPVRANKITAANGLNPHDKKTPRWSRRHDHDGYVHHNRFVSWLGTTSLGLHGNLKMWLMQFHGVPDHLLQMYVDSYLWFRQFVHRNAQRGFVRFIRALGKYERLDWGAQFQNFTGVQLTPMYEVKIF